MRARSNSTGLERIAVFPSRVRWLTNSRSTWNVDRPWRNLWHTIRSWISEHGCPCSSDKAVNFALIDTIGRLARTCRTRWPKEVGPTGRPGIVRVAPQEAPDLKGFSASNLWRMEQFYDVYVNKPKLAPQVRVLAWTHNLMIMGQNKRPEEREFYLMLAVRAKCSSCELAIQIKTAAFERTILSDKKLAALPRLLPQDASGFFKTDVSRTILALPCPSGGINLVLLPRSRSLKCGREDGHRTQKWRSLRFGSAISIGCTMPTWASFPSWRLASARPSCCLRLVLGGDSLSSTTMAICTWYLPA